MISHGTQEDYTTYDRESLAEMLLEQPDLAVQFQSHVERQRWSVCSSGSTWQKIFEQELRGKPVWANAREAHFDSRIDGELLQASSACCLRGWC